MSENKGYTVLDGTNPTLDASDLSYEFEKARIRGVSDERLESFYFREENKIILIQGRVGLPLEIRQVEKRSLPIQEPTLIVTFTMT